MKPYDLGLVCGRFQHMHIGHEEVINTGFNFCERILVLVGSAQECHTEKNPFDYYLRETIIKNIYPDEVLCKKIIVKPLKDMTNDPEHNISTKWGAYVLKHVKEYMSKAPDIMIYGNDEARSQWFDKEDIKDMMEIIVPRSKIKISATEMRKFLINNDFESWSKFANPNIHDKFEMLYDYLVSIQYDKLIKGENENE